MVGTLFVSAVGAAIGGGIIAYLAYQLGQKRHVVPADKRDDGSALLEGFSLDVWHLYMSVVCGRDVATHQSDAASERGLFLVSRLRGRADIEAAVFAMLGVLGKAAERAREHKRIGLRVTHAQFVDLSEQIAADFAFLQLEAERLRCERRHPRPLLLPSPAQDFLRRHRLKSASRLTAEKDRAAGR
jgi:hypothetical protein